MRALGVGSDELCFVSVLGELAGESVHQRSDSQYWSIKRDLHWGYWAHVCTDLAAFKVLAEKLILGSPVEQVS